MPEKVGKEKIERESGFLYYVKDGYVCRSPMKGKPGKKGEQMSKEKITVEPGFMYFLGKSGFVERAPRRGKSPKKEGGEKKKAAAPKKKE